MIDDPDTSNHSNADNQPNRGQNHTWASAVLARRAINLIADLITIIGYLIHHI